ncbi:MAG: LptA/OstA family protein, partial [Bryobacteraceae bacterium]
TGELHMKSQVELHWKGKTPDTKPMTIESGEAVYKEREAKVYLMPWSRLRRDTLTLDAGPAVVTLEDNVIRQVETTAAHGVQNDPDRKVEYKADQLHLELDEDGVITKITGEQNARLVETAATAQTTVTCDRVDLNFDAAQKDSALKAALASGHAVVASQPVERAGTPLAETRILTSDVVELHMQPGGREIAEVSTDARGSVEFVPNRPEQAHRWMTGERIWIKYGADNQIESVRSVKVTTRTENPAKAAVGQKTPAQPTPPAVTSSADLLAKFDPKTSQMSDLEQWGNFHYQAGPRQAQAERATLDQKTDVITLLGKARVWDPTGSAAGDKIVMNQKNGDFTALGNVASTRMPDKQGASSAMLSNDEPMQAKAQKMTSANKNLLIRYESNAVAWQGANRVQVDRIEIDRDNEILEAHGHVISQFVDKPAADPKPDEAKRNSAKKPAAAAVFTLVRSEGLVYTEDDRVADYTGGVVLNRPGMRVKADEIRAFLNDSNSGADSSLHHAFADGAVEIVQSANARTRTGKSEHAEYYAADQKVILVKGAPQMIDSLKGSTRGRELTYFANNDRLLVKGLENQPASSILHRK